MSQTSLWSGCPDAPAEQADAADRLREVPRPRPSVPAPLPQRRPGRGRPLVVDVLAAAAGIGLGVTIGLGINAETAGSLEAAGGWLTAAGRMAGLVAAYAMIVVVILVARFPPLERAVGQDRLISWHRSLGPWPLWLLGAHAVLITLGYAQQADRGALAQFWDLIWNYEAMLAATLGGLLLIAAGVSSYRKARRRLAYETWWSVHLYTYLALLLSFAHQVDTGASFVGHPVATAWWTALWGGTLALVVASRILLPLWRSWRHRLVVERVDQIGPGAVTVTMRGRRLDRLPVFGGQFMQWRFLRRGMWWQAHPYSLSAAPDGDRLRITVKDLGDHSRSMASLAPGTGVAIEGPYGTFTSERAGGRGVLLVGAGVGAAPLAALLGELPAGTDVTCLLRATSAQELVHADELRAGVAARGGRTTELVGPRAQVPLDAGTLLRLVPDLPQREVYLCGPDGFVERLRASLARAGVPAASVHAESFAF